jgi:hypothetical protein
MRVQPEQLQASLEHHRALARALADGECCRLREHPARARRLPSRCPVSVTEAETETTLEAPSAPSALSAPSAASAPSAPSDAPAPSAPSNAPAPSAATDAPVPSAPVGCAGPIGRAGRAGAGVGGPGGPHPARRREALDRRLGSGVRVLVGGQPVQPVAAHVRGPRAPLLPAREHLPGRLRARPRPRASDRRVPLGPARPASAHARGRAGRADGQRPARPGSHQCCVPRRRTPLLGHLRRRRDGRGQRLDQGALPGALRPRGRRGLRCASGLPSLHDRLRGGRPAGRARRPVGAAARGAAPSSCTSR